MHEVFTCMKTEFTAVCELCVSSTHFSLCLLFRKARLFLTAPSIAVHMWNSTRMCRQTHTHSPTEHATAGRYGDNVNESHAFQSKRAGIRAVVMATGSGPSCGKRERKHAVSVVTLSFLRSKKHQPHCS